MLHKLLDYNPLILSDLPLKVKHILGIIGLFVLAMHIT